MLVLCRESNPYSATSVAQFQMIDSNESALLVNQKYTAQQYSLIPNKLL